MRPWRIELLTGPVAISALIWYGAEVVYALRIRIPAGEMMTKLPAVSSSEMRGSNAETMLLIVLVAISFGNLSIIIP
ncbi:MAG: hypothetical protein A3D64_02525 [Candidatus Wildermuthbacteria bacterium RIFCSPHIGHO2_02_FULL_49_9]|uniref:Uncharacterized protein n=1 Tax=Candidatus Wildermuthbacteria bacterium RIFCSPHIGHO2_02_FULL_49_9 TaxID=1802456 RepID=A0A1G2RBA1_9BACT|nr:MAG: hypothetical protein A3D64_02525 [Candidatus Wildermuthbacteria bacterium RIFCSPHIGHO2_02_FULL_49_9]